MKDGKIRQILRFLPAAAVMAAIFYFSSQTGAESTAVSDKVISSAYGAEQVGELLPTTIVRKTAHFLEYALLGAALYFGLAGTALRQKRGRLFAVSLLCGALYAVTDEIHQYFVPGRCCRVRDVLIDSAGAAAGILICMLIFTRLLKSPPSQGGF